MLLLVSSSALFIQAREVKRGELVALKIIKIEPGAVFDEPLVSCDRDCKNRPLAFGTVWA